MTQRSRITFALLTATALLTGSAVAAVPAKAPTVVQEVISIERTAKTGLAALALIGKVQASKVPGFFATVDRYRSGAAEVGSFVDFNAASGLTKYGHGSDAPLCDAPIVCSIDLTTDTLTFTMTETDDADNRYSAWQGVTRFIALRGTKVDLQVAAIGFTVKRHTKTTFARVTKDQADADGVAMDGTGLEAFRSAQLAGGARGSFAVLQLPCDQEGVGAVTFSTAGDLVPPVAQCDPVTDLYGGQPVVVSGVGHYSDRPGLYSRSSNGQALWQVSGLVSGLSSTSTRLFVMSY